ncbi:MAG: hypothetical protein LBT01_00265 [Spirochaetaceae bacterium]|jgi:hypothetical protein|nr:hypothetical protein [Spirochaetaceae bacterium]
MKNKLFGIFLTLSISFIFFISCQSAPQTQKESSTEEGAVLVVEEVSVPQGAEETSDFDRIGLLIAEAQDRRQEIANDELEDLGGEQLSAADKSLQSAESVFNAGMKGSTSPEKASALSNAQSALDAYRAILRSYWQARADEGRGRSQAARQEALKLKAQVAVRDNFNASEGVFNNGESLYKSEDYKLSVPYYIESELMFIAAASLAIEKGRLAALALESADKKIEESEKISADADTALNGGHI